MTKDFIAPWPGKRALVTSRQTIRFALARTDAPPADTSSEIV